MRKNKRQKKLKLRKNFLPTLVVIGLLWTGITFVVYFIDPSSPGVAVLFFVLIFFAFLFTFATIFANTRRGLLASFGITLFLLLRYLGVGNVLNAILILGLLATAEVYFIKT